MRTKALYCGLGLMLASSLPGGDAGARTGGGEVLLASKSAVRAAVTSGNQAPILLADANMTAVEGAPVELSIRGTDPDTGDSLQLEAGGLPPGLIAVPGRQIGGERALRVYGILTESVRPNTAYDVRWSVSDGELSQDAHSNMQILSAPPLPADFEQRVQQLVTAEYFHGLPAWKARELGSRALPVLDRLLLEERYRPHWHKIVRVIGCIGDTAYFDTLRAFVWDRFHGEVDIAAFMALQSAQSSMSMMATIMPRALEYLIQASGPTTWSGLKWRVRDESPNEVARLMATHSLGALGLVDSDRAGAVLESLAASADSSRAAFIRGAIRVNARVRAKGLPTVWNELAGRSVGEGAR